VIISIPDLTTHNSWINRNNPDLFIKAIGSTQFYHLLGKLDVMNRAVIELSRALEFQDWLVYENAYSSRVIKCVLKLVSFKVRMSLSSRSSSLKMLFESRQA
jgi:hypothetical protein